MKHQRPPAFSSPAFSLLEVMVAMAILTVGLVSLLQVQARSAQLAIEAREMTVGTMLARAKLYDCQAELLRRGFSIGDFDEDGNFDDEEYPTYFWECHAYAPELPTGDGVGDLSALSGAGAGAAGDANAAQNPATDMAMGMMGPVLQQMATVMKDSIRELVVIVRWGQGADQQEIRVVTHLIDKGPVNQVSAMIAQQSQALTGALGGAGAPGTPGNGSPPSPGGNPGGPPIPKLPGGGGLK
jgi:prepilin-type N-terminal cleavage/methylation domain-containing protein